MLLVLGGVLLVDRFDPGWFVEPLLPPAAAAGAPHGAGAGRLRRRTSPAARAQARRLPQRGGDVGLVGEAGTRSTAVAPEGGEVFVHGERWRAVSSTPIPPGRPVVVRRVEGLTLFVEEVKT